MANEITTAEKATIDDDTHHALPDAQYSVTSSDETVATIQEIGGYWYVVAQGEGTTTIDAVRLSDNATGSMDVTVVAQPDPEAPGTFTILLGAISAK